MPSFDAGQTVITPGVTILTTAGAVHTARATEGITEPVAGSGVYHLAHPDPGTLLLFVFDVGVGTIGASVWDDGLQGASADALAAVDTVVDAVLVDTGTTLPAAVSAIPTNPVLTNDVRLDAIGTVSAYAPGQSPADLVDVSGIESALAFLAAYRTRKWDAVDDLPTTGKRTYRLWNEASTEVEHTWVVDMTSGAREPMDA